ncbi:hypothetical protein [Pseudomonas sp. K2I15]|uniref:hypothetical protein n=1 Tax=unclassified Pseudomonas TaxID=196821 RepID=UPI0021139486|nr:hypothetical protein [Pseudomonas sp. K2I15]
MSTISIIGSGDMAAAIGGLAAKAVELISRNAAKARARAEQIGAGPHDSLGQKRRFRDGVSLFD